jgi:hypothetical protein
MSRQVFWKHVILLLTKNLKIKQRNFKSTLSEILSPLLFCAMLASLSFLFSPQLSDPVVHYPVTSLASLESFLTHPETNETLFLLVAPANIPAMDCVIASISTPQAVKVFQTEDDLTKFYALNQNRTWAALVFSGGSLNDFTIRMDGAVMPDTSAYFSVSWQTDSFVPNSYVSSGFLSLQVTINRALMAIALNGTCLSGLYGLNIAVSQHPMGGLSDDSFHTLLVSIGAFYLVVGFSPFASKFLSLLVEEKQMKLREGMKMVGISSAAINTSWWLTYFLLALIPTLGVAVMASLTFFSHVSFFWVIIFAINC